MADDCANQDLLKVIEQAKQEWETAFDSIQDVIYIVDPDSRIVRANMAFADLMGLDIRDVSGKKCCDFFPHHHEMGCPAKVRGRRTVEFEFTGPPRRYYQESVHQVTRSQNKVVVVSDITALKLTEIRMEKMAREAMDANARLKASMDELKRTQAMLVESEKMASIALLAGRLAHEVNNPLGFIASNIRTLGGYCKDVVETLDMALQHGLTPELKQRVQKIDLDFIRSDHQVAAKEALEGVERISSILKAIADFVGAEEKAADVDLVTLVKDVVDAIRMPKGVDVKLDLAPVPVFRGLRDNIRLAVAQVVENAVVAVQDKGGGVIRVSLTHEQGRADLTIKDNGIGMDRETLKRAVDPFYTTRAPGPHIGMGLSIAHAVMQRHNGTITIDSTPGQGTTVVMQFPVPEKSQQG